LPHSLNGPDEDRPQHDRRSACPRNLIGLQIIHIELYSENIFLSEMNFGKE
jgi:hypothetical protein